MTGSGLRIFATIGLAVAAPLALVTGIFIGVTLVTGPPAVLWVVFLASLTLGAACVLLTVYLDASDRAAGSPSNGSGG